MSLKVLSVSCSQPVRFMVPISRLIWYPEWKLSAQPLRVKAHPRLSDNISSSHLPVRADGLQRPDWKYNRVIYRRPRDADVSIRLCNFFLLFSASTNPRDVMCTFWEKVKRRFLFWTDLTGPRSLYLFSYWLSAL